MKNNKKQINNRKRYLGNALSNAFFPVLASLGLTLGVTSVVITTSKNSSDGGEVAKSHDIVIPSVVQHGWSLKCENEEGKVISRAKKDEHVLFTAFKPTQTNIAEQPTAVMINGASYLLNDDMQAWVTINCIDTMNVSLVFPSTKDEHIVTFYMNDDSSTEKTTQIVVKDGDIVARPHDPVREYYTFDGWYTQRTGGEVYKFDEALTSETLNLYAHWKDTGERTAHTITLPEETEGWIVTGPTSAKIGETVVFTATKNNSNAAKIQRFRSLTLTDTEGEPRAFGVTKWIGNDYKQCEISVTIPFSKDMTATSQTEPIDPDKLAVAFDAAGGSSVESIKVEKGDTIPESPSTTWVGHEFLGWFYGDKQWVFGQGEEATKVTQDITLKALWKADTHKATFICTDGEPASQEQAEVSVGSMPTNPKTPVKTSTGYKHVFKGWLKNGSSEIGIEPMGLEDVTYYAQFTDIKEEYKVTFDLNGGESESPIPSQTIKYNETVIDPAVTPTKTGYTFKGWKDGTGKDWVFGSEGTKVTSDVTLYAKWEATKYTIIFNNEDGTQISKLTDLEYGSFPTVPSETPSVTKYGYISTFQTWENKEITEEGKYKGVVPVVGDATYTAVFKHTPKEVLVEFDTGDSETKYEPKIVRFGEKLDDLVDPTPATGKYFLGWYRDADFTWSWIPKTQTVDVEGSIKLYAQYVATDVESKEKFRTAKSDIPPKDILTFDLYSNNGATMNVVRVPTADKDGNEINALLRTFWKSDNFCQSVVKSVILPPTITTLVWDAFSEQTQLTSVNFSSVKHIGGYCFHNTGLTSLTIYDSLEYLGPRAFNSSKLKEVKCVHWPNYQGNDKLELGTYDVYKQGPFSNCGNLTSVTLPARLKNLGPDMFQNCNQLSSITFEGTMEQWEAMVKKQTTWKGGWSGTKTVVCSDGTLTYN